MLSNANIENYFKDAHFFQDGLWHNATKTAEDLARDTIIKVKSTFLDGKAPEVVKFLDDRTAFFKEMIDKAQMGWMATHTCKTPPYAPLWSFIEPYYTRLLEMNEIRLANKEKHEFIARLFATSTFDSVSVYHNYAFCFPLDVINYNDPRHRLISHKIIEYDYPFILYRDYSSDGEPNECTGGFYSTDSIKEKNGSVEIPTRIGLVSWIYEDDSNELIIFSHPYSTLLHFLQLKYHFEQNAEKLNKILGREVFKNA